MYFRKNISYFIKTKNFGNSYLFIFFILTFLLIFFNKTDYVVINKIKSFSIDIINPITQVVTAPIQITSQTINTINKFRFLEKENLKFREEIIRLKKWQTLALKNQRENSAYKKLLNSTTSNINIFKTAAVISRSPNIYAKTIIINVGLNQGISEDMPVINERGLVGKIISTSGNKSKVILINDPNFSAPVKTISNKFYAIIKGTSNGRYLTSAFIKDEKKPKIGDILITSGSTKNFPKDILVGKVIKVSEEVFLALPYVDFDNIEFVQVINTK